MRKLLSFAVLSCAVLAVSPAFGKFSDGYFGASGAFDVGPEKPATKADNTRAIDAKIAAAVARQPAPVPAVPLRQAISATTQGCSSGQCGR